jgi:hypothetical protein
MSYLVRGQKDPISRACGTKPPGDEEIFDISSSPKRKL